jgi:hypothetical protein
VTRHHQVANQIPDEETTIPSNEGDSPAHKRQLPVTSRYNITDLNASIVTIQGASVDNFHVLYSVTVIDGERARELEIRQASALKEILLWHYRRRKLSRVDRERPAA